ncbi:MAG TPA: hypothetical protein PKW35_24385, partial [Nannocystaceae bacterium]|nr:hypothetical protein [Nannocystaceae bacterium]
MSASRQGVFAGGPQRHRLRAFLLHCLALLSIFSWTLDAAAAEDAPRLGSPHDSASTEDAPCLPSLRRSHSHDVVERRLERDEPPREAPP